MRGMGGDRFSQSSAVEPGEEKQNAGEEFLGRGKGKRGKKLPCTTSN